MLWGWTTSGCVVALLIVTLCSGVTPDGAQSTIYGARDQTLVSFMQGKHLTCRTISPAPVFMITFISPATSLFNKYTSKSKLCARDYVHF